MQTPILDACSLISEENEFSKIQNVLQAKFSMEQNEHDST